jgi:hypothetical protein
MDYGTAGVIGSGINFLSSAITNAQNRKFQQQENEKNRQFNAMMAERQNQWNIQNWQMNNDYNSPANQKRRLLEAGLNPDLMYTGNGVAPSPMPNPSSSASSNGSVSPNPAPQLDMNSLLLGAQKDLLEAQARKAENEADYVQTTSEIQNGLKDGILEMQHLEILTAGNTLKISEGEVKKIEPTLRQLNSYADFYQQQVENARAQQRNIDADTAVKELQALFDSKSFVSRLDALNASIREIDARATLSYAEAARIGLLQYAELYNLDAQTQELLARKLNIKESTSNLKKEGTILDTNGERAKLDLTVAKNWQEFETEARVEALRWQYRTQMNSHIWKLGPLEVGYKGAGRGDH